MPMDENIEIHHLQNLTEVILSTAYLVELG